MPPKMAQKRSRDSPGSTKSVTNPVDRGATVPDEEQAEGGEPPIIAASDDGAPPSKRGRREKFNNSGESVSEDGGVAVGDGEMGGDEDRNGGDTDGTSRGDTTGAAAATVGSSPQTANSKRSSKRSSVTQRAEETGGNDEEQGDPAEASPEASVHTTKRTRKQATTRSQTPGKGGLETTPASAAAAIYNSVTHPTHSKPRQQQEEVEEQQQQQQQQQQPQQQSHANGKQAPGPPAAPPGANGAAGSKVASSSSSSSSRTVPPVPSFPRRHLEASGSAGEGAAPAREQNGPRSGKDATERRRELGHARQHPRSLPPPISEPSPRTNLPTPLHSSPSRTVPADTLRQITGSEPPPDSTPHGRRLGLRGDGVEGQGVDTPLGRFRVWVIRARVMAWQLRTCVGDVSSSVVLPVVHNLALRTVMMASLLLLSRLVWAGTLMVLAIGLGGRARDRGGSNPSPSDLVLAKVRESDPFQAFEDVERQRRALVAEMKSQSAQVSESLRSLREARATLSENMELLRAQASGGLASRGSPESPEVSEQVSRSLLEELEGLREEMNDLVTKTRQTVDDGQAWADDMVFRTSYLLPAMRPGGGGTAGVDGIGSAEEERIVAEEGALSEAWALEVSRPLREAFGTLSEAYERLRAVEDALPAGLVTMEDAEPLLEDVREAARVAAAAAAASNNGDDPVLRERVEAATALQMELEWSASSGEERGSDSLSSEVLTTLQQAEELVAKEVEVFVSGGSGMPDFASVRSGAAVVHGAIPGTGGGDEELTSPTYPRAVLPWPEYVLHSLRVPGHVYGEGPEAALSVDNTLGSCFAFAGGAGRLTVRLARHLVMAASLRDGSGICSAPPGSATPSCSSSGGSAASGEKIFAGVRVSHVSIEHPRIAYAPSSAKSALRAFRVLGWEQDPTRVVDPAVEGGKVSGTGDAGVPRPYVLVDGAEYRVGDGAPGVQTFAVSDAAREAAPAVKLVTLQVESNHGGIWTCLYGFRVHGEPVAVEM